MAGLGTASEIDQVDSRVSHGKMAPVAPMQRVSYLPFLATAYRYAPDASGVEF